MQYFKFKAISLVFSRKSSGDQAKIAREFGPCKIVGRQKY